MNPFPTLSINKTADTLGASLLSSPDFYSYAGSPAPAGTVSLSMGDYSVPIYDASQKDQRPNTLVKVYQSVWARNLGIVFGARMSPGVMIPWNFNWKPGTGTDKCMIVENFPEIVADNVNGTVSWGNQKYRLDYTNERMFYSWITYDNIASAWDFWGPNVQAGYNNIDNAHKIAIGAGGITYNNYNDKFEISQQRGCGLNKRAGILTADDVLSGHITHALEITITNTSFCSNTPGVNGKDYFSPAQRCEWTTATAPHRGSYFDPNPAHNIPHGSRYRLTWSDQDINNYIAANFTNATDALKATIGTIVKCLCEYGFIVMETGGWGCTMETTGLLGPDKPKWNTAGVASTAPLSLPNLLKANNLQLVRAVL
jgi:hypothetical protein